MTKDIESELILCITEHRSPKFDQTKVEELEKLAEQLEDLAGSTAAKISIRQKMKVLRSKIEKVRYYFVSFTILDYFS